MTGRDEKHCGRLTDHAPHDWQGCGHTTVATGDTTWYDPPTWIGPDYWCKGTIVVEGGHW